MPQNSTRVQRSVTLGASLSQLPTGDRASRAVGLPARALGSGPLRTLLVALCVLLSGQALAKEPLRFVFLELADPPLAVRVAEARAAGHPMAPDEQRAWVGRLAARQVAIEAQVVAAGADVVWRYQRVLDGLQVRATESVVARLAALDGVVAVRPVLEVRPTTQYTVPFIGAATLVNELGLDGTGVDIGVIDSGVDYLHAAFGGPATEAAYQANDPTTIGDTLDGAPLFPTAKVVGGTDFVGEDYDAETYDLPAPDPDPMPSYNKLDPETGEITAYDEHGTHVAATAAGMATEELAPGVAPGARIWALKVFGQGSTTLMTAAVEWASDPDGDGDLSDALDVLNLSLGSSYGGTSGATADQKAIDAFVGLGGIVVAAAGNDGDIPFIHGSPAAYPSVISVANTYGPGEVGTFVVVEEPAEIAGQYPARQASKQFAPTLSNVGPVTGGLVYAEDGCTAAAFPEETSGAIALIDRGGCTFSEKLGFAAAAGAVAAVVINNEDGEPIAMSGSPGSDIPGVMLWKETGDPIRAAIVAGAIATVTVGSGLPNPALADIVHGSSSRGPGFMAGDGAIVAKPDVAAPGAHIRAARAGTGTKTKSKTGTSMATPHVAGLAALLRQAHPTWSPRDLKARLVTTAAADWTYGNPATGSKGPEAPASWGGAGRVDAVAAVKGDVVATGDPSVAVELGLVALTAPVTLTRTVLVQNHGTEPASFSASFAWRGAPKAGAVVTVEPASVTVPAGGSETLTLTAALDPAALAPWGLGNRSPDAVHVADAGALGDVEIAGAVVLDGEAEQLRVPVYGLARPTGAVHVTEACLSATPALALANDSAVDGWTEQFTLLAEDKNEPAIWDGADIRAIGGRWVSLGGEQALQLALVTWGARPHPGRAAMQVYLDTTHDGVADFVLVVRFDDWQYGPTYSGRPVGVLLALSSEADPAPVDQQYVVSDVLSSRLVLTVTLASLGLDSPSGGLGLWAVSASPEATGADLVPDSLNAVYLASQQAPIVLGGPCAEWRVEPRGFAVKGSTTATFAATPTCADGAPAGLLLLHENGSGEAEVIHAPDVDVSGLCVAQADVAIPAGECDVALAAGDLAVGSASVGACALGVTPQGVEPVAVGAGDTNVVVQLRDDLGRIHGCPSVVRAIPVDPPHVTCPAPEPLVRAALPWAAPLEAACGAALKIAEVTCVGAQDRATGCDVSLSGGELVVAHIDAGATAVEVRLMATDGAGQTAEQTCTLAVAVPGDTKPDPDPQIEIDAGAEPGSVADAADASDAGDEAGGDDVAAPAGASSDGCGAAPGGGGAAWIVVLLAGLALAARRRGVGQNGRSGVAHERG